MNNEGIDRVLSLQLEADGSLNKSFKKESSLNVNDRKSKQPQDQLAGGLLGWYSACNSENLTNNALFFFSMYNEPLVLYRDKNNVAKCIKDLCPHRGASFQGGELQNGELVCPYHGARFSSQGTCTNIERITCQHIVDDNYDNYAKKIHLYQYPCVEKDGYIYIYYTGNAKTNLKEFDIKSSLEDLSPSTYGFQVDEYTYEEVLVDFKCDWTRILENHLDILHIFWVHGNTIPDKDVNKNIITSFNQEIIRDTKQIESKYYHKGKNKSEFITIKFIPPGRIIIYKGDLSNARYVQVLDHIPLGENKARAIVRHYRKFLKNKLISKLIMFKELQQKLFYKVFSEDYLILRTQTFNQQMGYIEKDNVKLLGEDKMVQYYWHWLNSALLQDRPWEIHPKDSGTNTVHDDMRMLYPPENPKLSNINKRNLILNSTIRILIPFTLLVLIL